MSDNLNEFGHLVPKHLAEFLAEENARLKDEVELLTKQRDIAICDFWNIHRGYFDLKAEVERLRKAQ